MPLVSPTGTPAPASPGSELATGGSRVLTSSTSRLNKIQTSSASSRRSVTTTTTGSGTGVTRPWRSASRSRMSDTRSPDSALVVTDEQDVIEVKRPSTALSIGNNSRCVPSRPWSTTPLATAQALYYASAPNQCHPPPHYQLSSVQNLASTSSTNKFTTNKSCSNIVSTVPHVVSGNRCLSPVIHSSQMGTENLPSPRTLYIPATRRTETTTKHIIVSTETKRKKRKFSVTILISTPPPFVIDKNA